jgi:hypothetical protein
MIQCRFKKYKWVKKKNGEVGAMQTATMRKQERLHQHHRKPFRAEERAHYKGLFIMIKGHFIKKMHRHQPLCTCRAP